MVKMILFLFEENKKEIIIITDYTKKLTKKGVIGEGKWIDI